MNEFKYMISKTNSFEGVKEKYRKAIIENYRDSLRVRNTESARIRFDKTQNSNASYNSLGANDRWAIVSKKNFFGLEASFLPENAQGTESRNMLYLKLNSGRFEMQKFPKKIFPNEINISDIGERSEEEQFAEVEEFYNMNNRQVFEKYGVNARRLNDEMGEMNLIACCLVLDSLLQGIGQDMEEIFCTTSSYGYIINIKLEDYTEISANSTNLYGFDYDRGITIKKFDGKNARVEFQAISTEHNADMLKNINNLEVKHVEYSGDSELIGQLQQAMQEQFKSQQEKVEDNDKSKHREIQKEGLDEILGAQKIIEYMKRENLEPHDLALALSMMLAKTTDKANAEQHIIDSTVKDIQSSKIRDNEGKD